MKNINKNCLSIIDKYLIKKAWQLRGTEEFTDLETAKLIIRGKADV